MYEFTLLGSGQAYYDGKPITGFPVQQHCLLFYYLLLNRDIAHTREQLATVFWGDDPSPVARKNLRNTLWKLNQSFRSAGASLDDVVTIEEDFISFTHLKVYRLDIDEFEAAMYTGSNFTSKELGPEQAALLESATKLYRGDLLEGVYDDWCIYERERLRLGFVNILIRLMDYHGQQGSYERGLEYGHRILLMEPTRERVHRQIMMFHWKAGNRDAALLQYRKCCKVLQDELGIKPAQETRHLYETILHRSAFSNPHAQAESVQPADKIGASISPPLGEMLQKLHFLEMIVDQANTELHLLERMIHQVLETK